LVFLSIALAALAFGFGYGLHRARRKPQPKAQAEPADDFRERSQKLLEAGELDDVVALARERIAAKPNYTYAHWYLGRALYLQQKWTEALHAFNDVARIDPRWVDDSVTPYVRAIEAKLRPRDIPMHAEPSTERTLH
jgi:cytochrome c-type biogenesis protein CcmH/NrfG